MAFFIKYCDKNNINFLVIAQKVYLSLLKKYVEQLDKTSDKVFGNVYNDPRK